MKSIKQLILAVCFTNFIIGGTSVAEPVLEKIEAQPEMPTSLPRYLTEEEKLLPPLQMPARFAPPTGSVYCPAEYEYNDGIFFAWEGYTNLITQMTVAISTQDPDAICYVVVDSNSEKNSVTTTLTNAGADMSQVEFVVRTTNTVWIRDYGPRFIYEDDVKTIIDHTYNRPRPSDNALNDYISSSMGIPEYDIPLYHGGGNFHLFANGEAFMTDLILDENPGMSAADVEQLYLDYQNLDLTIYPGFPTWFDSTQHIDMWMLPVDDDEIIIGEYSPSAGQPYTITENAVADLISRGYTVHRTPGWNSGGTHYTYTNAVIMNDIVFMPTFNGYTTQNNASLAVFQAAFEDKTVIEVDCSSIIHAAGAIHCIVMHMPGMAEVDCPADLTGDEQVNIDDIFAILGIWGACADPCPPYCTGDLTEDCMVNIDDIFAILGQWGPCN